MNINKENFIEAMKYAKSLCDKYNFCLFAMPNKFGKLLNRLSEQGFTNYVVYGENEIKDLVKY